MLRYLIILLDDTSTSYCHYNNPKTEKRLIALDDLKAGIVFAMKQNMTIQFIYPSYEIPAAYHEAIETIDHVKIMPADLVVQTHGNASPQSADVVVFNSWDEFEKFKFEKNNDKIFVLRVCGRDDGRGRGGRDAINRVSTTVAMFSDITRLNIIITDIETFTESDLESYKQWLAELAATIVKTGRAPSLPQINLLTDRILLDKMNNCNAGIENITLAPNGEFYICPAFYMEDEEDSIGNLKKGLDIKNRHLYKLEYAPLCRICDAYQCKRCVWLNRKTTLEVNTPSREQCVVAHLERNASEYLLNELKPAGYFKDKKIPAIDYLDPFDIIRN